MKTLCLSGGGLHGMSHIGIIKCLRENHISIDYWVGGSAGAIVAAAGAIGLSVDEMIAFAKIPSIWDYDLNFPSFKYGILKGDKLHQLFQKHFKGKVGDYPVTLTAVSLNTSETIVCPKEMPLADAIRASMSIDGVFCPFKYDNLMLTDGGLINKLPIAFVPKTSDEVTIGIVNGAAKNNAKDNLLNLLCNIYGIASDVISNEDVRYAKQNFKKANIVTTHIDKGNALTSFGMLDTYIQQGYDAAKEVFNG